MAGCPLLRMLGLAACNPGVLKEGVERLSGLFLRIRPRLQRASRNVAVLTRCDANSAMISVDYQVTERLYKEV